MAFNPTAVTGCVAHWEPDDLSGTSLSDVTSFDDAVNTINLASSSSHPQLMLASSHSSGKQAVVFRKTASRLAGSDAVLNQGEVTYIFVCCAYNVEADMWFFNKDNTNPATIGMRILQDSSDYDTEGIMRLDGSEGTTRKTQATTTDRTNQPHVFAIRYDGADLEIFQDGTLISTDAYSGAIDTDNAADLVLGNHPTTNKPMNLWFGNFAVWDNAISDADLATLTDDLIADWKIGDYQKEWTTGSRSDVITPGAGENEYFSPCIIDDGSQYVMFYAVNESAGGTWRYIDYATATYGSPDSFTKVGTAVDSTVDSPTGCRGVGAVHDGTDYHLLVDAGDGSLYHFQGSSLGSLTDNGSVYSGATGDLAYARHPTILPVQESSKWVVYFDGRSSSATSGFGAIGRVTTSDFSTWDAATEVLSTSDIWWEATDVGAPAVRIIDGVYVMLYAGFNNDIRLAGDNASHFIGVAKSDDGETWTKLPEQVPVLTGTQSESTISVENPEFHIDSSGDYWLYYVSKDAAIDADIVRVKFGSELTGFYSESSGFPFEIYYQGADAI